MKLQTSIERWPVQRPFKIAYHTFTDRELLCVAVSDGEHTGHGEAGGHPHLEALSEAQARVLELQTKLTAGLSNEDLLNELPPGPGRNALDCALWDLRAKQTGQRIWELADLPAPVPLQTAYTIGIAPPAEMQDEARQMHEFRLLKLKVDGESGFTALEAIAAARPDAEFIIDANEGWQLDQLQDLAENARRLRVQLIEQPLPRNADQGLRDLQIDVPIAADESFHDTADLPALAGLYQVVNIKLDKIGGLTEALRAARAARALGLKVMVGCNGATSLGIAPAYCLGLLCDYIDLDSPLLMARDRNPGASYQAGHILPPDAALWG